MKELLFLDRNRLDRYCAQVVPSMSVVEGAAERAAEFSITGPKVTLGEKQRVRPLTDFEKMDRVLVELSRTGEVTNQRPETDDDGPAFVHERRCTAVKVIVPRAAAGTLEQPEFTLWLAAAPPSTRAGMLCLLEDFRGEDDRPVNFRQASTYTLLQSLIHYTRSLSGRTLLDRYVPTDMNPPYARFEGKPDSLAQYANVKEFAYDFATNPVPLLSAWGCVAGSARSIEVLYRIREFGRDSAHSWDIVTAFGYPVWIVEA